MPVATSTRIPSRGTPLASRTSSIGSRISRFGTGRVMSQTTMHALRRPRANSASGGVPVGSDNTRRTAATGY